MEIEITGGVGPMRSKLKEMRQAEVISHHAMEYFPTLNPRCQSSAKLQ